MVKIDKTDLENISFIKKELKLKNVTSVKIKKGDYEIELSSSISSTSSNISGKLPLETQSSEKSAKNVVFNFVYMGKTKKNAKKQNEKNAKET